MTFLTSKRMRFTSLNSSFFKGCIIVASLLLKSPKFPPNPHPLVQNFVNNAVCWNSFQADVVIQSLLPFALER